jgi:hypothetical protein
VAVCRGAFGGTAAQGKRLVVGCTDGPAAVDEAGDQLTVAWHGPSGRSGAPLIAGDVVWVVQNSGRLRGLDLASGQVRADIDLGGAVPGFPTPTAVGKRLLVPAGSTLRAFSQ